MILAAFVLSLPAQLPDVKLNYTTVAVPLSRICEDLSKQAGRRLRVHEDLAAEPVIIRFKDVPASEGLGKIAQAVSAEWVEGKGESLLVRTQKMQQKLEEAQYAARLEQFQKQIGAIRKRVRERGPFGDKEATEVVLEFKRLGSLPAEQQRMPGIQKQQQLIRESLPSARFAERLMSLMDAAELASTQQDEKLWLSNKPNSAQLPLRGYDPAWLSEFVAEHSALVRAARRETVEWLMYAPYDQEISEGDLKLLVSVSSRGLDFTIADETGLIVTRSNHGWAPMSDAIQERIDRLTLQNDPSEQPIKLSQRARDFAALYQTRRPVENKPRIVAPELRETLLNPERVDPLATIFSDIVLSTTDKNLVAYAPDSSFIWAFVVARTDSNKPSFILASLESGGFKVSDDEQWLVVAIEHPLNALESRTPRPLLGEFIRQADKDGFVSIEAAAHLGLSAPDHQLLLAPEYVGFLLGFGEGQLFHEMDVLRFYGSLTPEQRIDLAESGSRPLSYFSSYQKELIHRFMWEGHLRYMRPTTDNPEEVREYIGMYPCESFPDGLPPETPIQLSIKDEQGYLMRMLAGSYPTESASDFNGIATYYAQMQRPDVFKWIPNQPMQGVTPSRNFTLQLEARPGDLWSFGRYLQANQKTGRAMTLDEFLASLSDEERVRFDEVVKKANASFANLKDDWFTQGTPNPPPRPPQ